MTTGLTVMDDKVYTVEDYMKLDDGNSYELIGGKLFMVPKPRDRHQLVALRLASRMLTYVEQHSMGQVREDMEIHFADMDETKIVAPDVFFVSNDRASIIADTHLTAAPDLVVEVLSPSTRSHDQKRKGKIYFDNGVKEYWLVDPWENNVEVLLAGEGNWSYGGVFDQEDVLTTSLLPGLEIKLEDVFA